MSGLFQPGQPFSFLFQDGLDNLYFRNSSSVLTSGTGLDPLRSIPIPANTFTIDGQMMRLISQGQMTGAGGTKRLAAGINGTQNVFNTGLIAAVNNFWINEMFITRFPGSVLFVTNRFTSAVGAPGATPTNHQLSTLVTAQDFGVAFTVDFFGEVSVGADAVQQDVVHVTFV